MCTTCNTNCNSTCSPSPCPCKVFLSSDCIDNFTEDLPCSNILKGQTLTETLLLLDAYICERFESVTNFFDLINVGTGAEIYKGVSILGKKELKTLLDSNLINLTEGTNEITISVNETALNTFIEANQKTYSSVNIGIGAQVYKNSTVVGDNTQFNLRKIKTENSGTGAVVLKTQVENIDDISIIAKSISSSSLTVTETSDEISIEVPSVSDIPALIVNSSYTGDEEIGTASKPFKTIQGALDAYVGTGGRGTIASPLNPELMGSIIEIQKGTGAYTFTGDIDYKDVYISLRQGTIIQATTSEWITNFNNFSTTTPHNPIISLDEGATIYCNKNGFKLVGGDFTVGTGNSKVLKIKGNLGGIILVGTLESHILFEVDDNNLQYLNGGYGHLEINTNISTNRGRMFVIKGNGSVMCDTNTIYFINDSSSVIITNTYFPIELKNNAILVFKNNTISLGKTSLVTYNQLVHIEDSSLFQAFNSLFQGEAVYFTYNNTASNMSTIELDSCKMYMLTTSSFAGTISGIWENMFLTNNNMPSTSINPLTTSISPSALNTIGRKLIETLDSYSSKNDAVSAGLPTGAKFINKNDIIAGNFVIGVEYKILTVGTTDYTTIGATSNTIGLYFTATGIGSGSGVASLIRVDTVI